MIKNLIESIKINIKWHNLYVINKIILIVFFILLFYVGIRYLIKDIIWLIGRLI